MWSPSRIITLLIFVLASCAFVLAQNVEESKVGLPKSEQEKETAPKSIQETLEKMRIDKDKKDHEEMVDRGDEALRISSQLEKSFERNGRLSNEDIGRLDRVEKLAKKIRDELGGHEDNGDGDDDGVGAPSLDVAVKTLLTSAGTLYDELKKTSRFTISAAAIQSSNTVLRLARLLRLAK